MVAKFPTLYSVVVVGLKNYHLEPELYVSFGCYSLLIEDKSDSVISAGGHDEGEKNQTFSNHFCFCLEQSHTNAHSREQKVAFIPQKVDILSFQTSKSRSKNNFYQHMLSSF
jgi:hypothetical protein